MRLLPITILFVLLGATLCCAETLQPFDFKVPPVALQNTGTQLECTFGNMTIPDNAVVYAAGGYAGRKIDFQIDQSGHETTQFDVAVNSIKRPVLLMLGAYEPTIWNIGWSEGTTILAVLVSGYHRQAVAGLPENVPLIISSHDNKGPCGYFYVGKDNKTLNPKARSLFGKPVELVYLGDTTGSIIVGDPITGDDKLVTSSRISPASFRDPDTPLAGKPGLEEAVAKGIIRPATLADAQRWVDAVAANSKEDVPPIAGQGKPKPPKPSLHNAYVVLQKFTYPAGLYGGNLATFFIEKDVPRPDGNPGHSAVYDFNTLLCSGPPCRMN